MEQTSVVTPDRFDHALSYADYLAAIAVNRDQFEHFYDIASLSDDDIAFFKHAAARTDGPARVLVIAEAWCPDVFRGVPVVARIAEASGMTMKIVLRDENPDIMDEFLLNGRARAIPVAVFYTRDHHYIAHWIERPAVAHAEIARLRAAFSAAHPAIDIKTATGPDRETLLTFFNARLPQQYPAWQVETVREIRELLAAAPGAGQPLGSSTLSAR
jgi:thioredoxin family protein